jgi:hypothetical protein
VLRDLPRLMETAEQIAALVLQSIVNGDSAGG